MRSIDQLNKRLKALRKAKDWCKKRVYKSVGCPGIPWTFSDLDIWLNRRYDSQINRCIRLRAFATQDLLNKARC